MAHGLTARLFFSRFSCENIHRTPATEPAKTLRRARLAESCSAALIAQCCNLRETALSANQDIRLSDCQHLCITYQLHQLIRSLFASVRVPFWGYIRGARPSQHGHLPQLELILPIASTVGIALETWKEWCWTWVFFAYIAFRKWDGKYHLHPLSPELVFYSTQLPRELESAGLSRLFYLFFFSVVLRFPIRTVRNFLHHDLGLLGNKNCLYVYWSRSSFPFSLSSSLCPCATIQREGYLLDLESPCRPRITRSRLLGMFGDTRSCTLKASSLAKLAAQVLCL